MFYNTGKIRCVTTHFVMLVKDTLKEEVSVVVKFCGAVRRDLYPGGKWTDRNLI